MLEDSALHSDGLDTLKSHTYKEKGPLLFEETDFLPSSRNIMLMCYNNQSSGHYVKSGKTSMFCFLITNFKTCISFLAFLKQS
jgi:hypothetical protein